MAEERQRIEAWIDPERRVLAHESLMNDEVHLRSRNTSNGAASNGSAPHQHGWDEDADSSGASDVMWQPGYDGDAAQNSGAVASGDPALREVGDCSKGLLG